MLWSKARSTTRHPYHQMTKRAWIRWGLSVAHGRPVRRAAQGLMCPLTQCRLLCPAQLLLLLHLKRLQHVRAQVWLLTWVLLGV